MRDRIIHQCNRGVGGSGGRGGVKGWMMEGIIQGVGGFVVGVQEFLNEFEL